MPVGIDPKVDYAFKWLFGREGSTGILIDLLHAVLNPPPEEQIAEIQILNPFSEKMAMDDKLAVLDVRARDQRGRQFNVEMQMLGYPSLPQRILFYWSKLYTGQIQSGDDYRLLRPTVSVCFVDGVVFPAVSDCHSCFRLVEPRHGVAFTDDIRIHLIELPKFEKPAGGLATALDGWLYFLRHAETMDPAELPGSMQRPELHLAMEALMMLAQTDMQREIYEGREKARRDERARLFDAQTVGFDKGYGEGFGEGFGEGVAKGELIGRIETLQLVLGLAPTPKAELEPMSVEELQRLADELQRRLGR